MATLQGEAVDRPAVNFYEIGGLRIDPTDADPFNVYNDPSWRDLLELAEQETDLIRMRSAVRAHSHEAWDSASAASHHGIRQEILKTETIEQDSSRLTRVTLTIAGRELTSLTRRDADVDTLWTVEHLLKDEQDLKTYLQLPGEFFSESIDIGPLVSEEQAVGDRGIVMVDTEDPLCAAATLFAAQDFAIVAFREPALFHQLLEKLTRPIHERTDQVVREFPGHLWRIYGPEFATEPLLPSRFFAEYVVPYTGPMVRMIQRYGGFVRLHCHGRIRNVLPQIAAMAVDAIDPIEPPPQGDVQLADVRRQYGEHLVLFGNLEVSDIENLAPAQFDQLVQQTLEQGTAGTGRGFVLMPSSSPFSRKISQQTFRNYETMVRRAQEFKMSKSG